MYDIIVIGAGPAGLTAALYARRADRSVLVLEKETFGGQITYSPRVENYPGFMQISGNAFADQLMDQVMAQGADIELDTVTAITGKPGHFILQAKGKSYEGKSVIIAAGSRHRRLGLPGEDRFTGQGVSYCAVCDGAFYKDKTVAVIGGGNTALQEAVLLSQSCKKVYVIQNLGFLTGERRLADELGRRENVTLVFDTVVTELYGEQALTGIGLRNEKAGETRSLAVDGIFVAIGQQPENEPFGSVLTLDDDGYIAAGEDCVPDGAPRGIFAAGDCRCKRIRQITTATADGAVAALAACRFLEETVE